MAELTARELRELDRHLDKLRDAVRTHIIEKYPEKGPWRDEEPLGRVANLENRIRLIRRLVVGGPVGPKTVDLDLLEDDGRPRTIEGELVKLLSSGFILGDEAGAWGERTDTWPPR